MIVGIKWYILFEKALWKLQNAEHSKGSLVLLITKSDTWSCKHFANVTLVPLFPWEFEDNSKSAEPGHSSPSPWHLGIRKWRFLLGEKGENNDICILFVFLFRNTILTEILLLPPHSALKKQLTRAPAVCRVLGPGWRTPVTPRCRGCSLGAREWQERGIVERLQPLEPCRLHRHRPPRFFAGGWGAAAQWNEHWNSSQST